MTTFCNGCTAHEGRLHALGCTHEECPFCGGSLAFCECLYDELGLRDPALPDTQHHLPLALFENGPSQEHELAWRKVVDEKGRIPVQRLAAPPWTGRGDPPGELLLRCFEAVLERPGDVPEGAVVDLPQKLPTVMGTFGVRLFRPVLWEDAAGDPQSMRPRVALTFEPDPGFLAELNGAPLRTLRWKLGTFTTVEQSAWTAVLEKRGWVSFGDVARMRAVPEWQGAQRVWTLRFQAYDDFTERLQQRLAALLPASAV